MKYKIIYDKKGRLRIRCGKFAFAEKEGYGIAALLKKEKSVTEVITCDKNGSVLIQYQDYSKREHLLKKLSALKKQDIISVEAEEKDKVRKIDDEFQNKIAKMVARRILVKNLLPAPIRVAMTIFKAVPYIKEGLCNLLKCNINVSVLDASAVSASLAYGSFDSAASIMFLLSISGLLEDYTRKRTKNALTSSLAVNIDTVWLVTKDAEILVPLSEIKKEDKIKIRTGGMIPVDGIIADGEAMVNEATMTGEPLAVRKEKGISVYAGTVVEEGAIVIEVLALDSETRIHKIIKMIDQSELLKANIQSKAEKLADSIVPFSFLTSIATYLFTRNVSKALSVLMVDYSCAIKLSTPISIISAMKEAAEYRVMVKGGKYLEAFAEADTIIFDKTGTLTEACPQVEKVLAFDGYSREEVLKTAACLEEHFPHSVAKAIVKQAKKEKLHHKEEHAEVQYVVAHGIASFIGTKKVLIGSAHFVFDDEKISVTKQQQEYMEKELGTNSVVYLAIGGELAGVICINDPVRKDAVKAIINLKKLGIKDVIMLTGDSENAAKAVCDMLSITKYRAQILPGDKANIIHQLKAEGKKVIMVGDGINDTPALSAADVSVAMKDSSDIAKEVADITLLSSHLDALVTMRLLSRSLMRRINRNYQFILGFNTMLLGFGLFGILTPSASALYHNLSTMAVSAVSMRPCLTNRKE